MRESLLDVCIVECGGRRQCLISCTVYMYSVTVFSLLNINLRRVNKKNEGKGWKERDRERERRVYSDV